jgi:hypothetical protein
VIVTLTQPECAVAAHAGTIRQRLNQDRTHQHGYTGVGWDIHIEGAGAEMALAKYLGIYWVPAQMTPQGHAGDAAADVGPFEVRQTARANGSLILHKTDFADRAYVLVTGTMPTYNLQGWLYAADGWREEWWRSDVREPAYFVPQDQLRMDRLPT